ncbi:MAG: adenylate/guanylate cyclase domain-containing protein [Gammaproteobacteria bacterium]|nr:adenylate/guanylate cyclase domain-containing protein [Gammaproteobacteria bacterium]
MPSNGGGTLLNRVNTGEVIAGNIGSEVRMDYTVVGDNVNVASRVEGMCEPGKVLLSEETFNQVRDHVQATRMDPIRVKNRDRPVQTYSINIGDS